jgi:septin family protein
MWNLACDRAGIGTKDNRTGRRIYHLHSLRKFFRTKIGLDIDLTNALMGHSQYFDASYLRLDQNKEVAEAYKEAIPTVSVYQVESQEIEDMREETEEWKKDLEKENKELKQRLEKQEERMKRTEEKLTEIMRMLKDSM